MPAWMTSLLRELMPLPMPGPASSTRGSRPCRASSRATARPTPPAPTTAASIRSMLIRPPWWLLTGNRAVAKLSLHAENRRTRQAVDLLEADLFGRCEEPEHAADCQEDQARSAEGPRGRHGHAHVRHEAAGPQEAGPGRFAVRQAARCQAAGSLQERDVRGCRYGEVLRQRGRPEVSPLQGVHQGLSQGDR